MADESVESGFELVVVQGGGKGMHRSLDRPLMTMGRLEENDEAAADVIAFAEPTVSRVHAVLEWNARGQYYIICHRSRTNPTLVNGYVVNDRQRLLPGDEIQMGQLVAELRKLDRASGSNQAGEPARPENAEVRPEVGPAPDGSPARLPERPDTEARPPTVSPPATAGPGQKELDPFGMALSALRWILFVCIAVEVAVGPGPDAANAGGAWMRVSPPIGLGILAVWFLLSSALQVRTPRPLPLQAFAAVDALLAAAFLVTQKTLLGGLLFSIPVLESYAALGLTGGAVGTGGVLVLCMLLTAAKARTGAVLAQPTFLWFYAVVALASIAGVFYSTTRDEEPRRQPLAADVAGSQALGSVVSAVIDPVSGLYTNSYFQERLGEEIAKARKAGEPLSLILLDVDHFERVNDTHGHPQGDLLLKQLGTLVRSLGQEALVSCRYGGDEFSLILANTNGMGAAVCAEQLRESIESFEFRLGNSFIRTTVTGGVASFPDDAETKNDLVEKADHAMYLGKQRGRNCIILSE